MKTKDKVKFWLTKYPALRDNDNRLCSNIWASEVANLEGVTSSSDVSEFLVLYANNKLTSAPSIKRARAKLQEECPEYRGEKYNLRKGVFQKEWRTKLGYNNG